MLYHALALARTGASVSVVGGAGSDIRREISAEPRISWHILSALTSTARPAGANVWFAPAAVIKACRVSIQLARVLLWQLPRFDVLLVQNPPAIPTLLIAIIAARVRGARLVIDWHNLGHAMLALRLGEAHPLVRIARWHEYRAAHLASSHLCVSQAMRARLHEEIGIDAAVSLDRPAEFFRPTPRADRIALFERLVRTQALPSDLLAAAHGDASRPAIVVTATSWTADEDLPLLIDAARAWEARRLSGGSVDRWPRLRILITGRGPLREAFDAAVARLHLVHVSLHTLWLEPDDYPRLLGACDLGVSLHRSASGVDLPMKIADMFGAGLPVCALDYGATLAEQLQPGVNGLLFTTADELAEQWDRLFADQSGAWPRLDTLRQPVSQAASWRWNDEWQAHAKPLLVS